MNSVFAVYEAIEKLSVFAIIIFGFIIGYLISKYRGVK